MPDTPPPAQEFRNGAVEIVPLGIGVGVYGLAFGLLAAQALMSQLQVGVMGVIVFAGASQILVVERLVAGAGAAVAVIAGVAINLRLLLVIASVRDIFAGRPWWQQVLGGHFATDENWALLLAGRAQGRRLGYWYLLGGGVMLICIWIVATVLGVTLATQIPEPRALGMDFAFTAAFIAVARALWTGRRDLIPWVSSAVLVSLAVAGLGLDASWAILLGGIGGAVIAALLPGGARDDG